MTNCAACDRTSCVCSRFGRATRRSRYVEQHGDRLADLSEHSSADVATNLEDASRRNSTKVLTLSSGLDREAVLGAWAEDDL